MGACKCNNTLGNTGTPNCQPLAAVTVADFLVPLYDSTGARNFLDPAVTLVYADYVAKVNDPDPSKRWYPLTNLKNLTPAQADTKYETYDDESKSFIMEGIISSGFTMPNMSPKFLGKLKNWRCVKFGIYAVDAYGTVTGLGEGDGKLYPIGIDNTTWNAVFTPISNSSTQKVVVTYQYLRSSLDENLEMVVTDIPSLATLNGLQDVYATITAKTVNGFTAKLYTDEGPINDKITVKGLLVTDFVIYNVTGAVVVAKTMVESTPGTYVFTYTVAQTGTNVESLRPTKAGFDFSAVAAATFTVI